MKVVKDMKNPLLKKLNEHMKVNEIDLVYLDDPQTVSYFTQFESNPHERIVALLSLQESCFLFTPELEREEALSTPVIKEVISYKDDENPWSIINNELKKRELSIKKVGIDESTLNVSRYHSLKEITGTSSFFDLRSFLQDVRLVKTEDEIERMKIAGEFADKALEIGFNALKEGITEQEVVAEIEYQLKKMGIPEMSFPTMVLFGDHAGSPHGTPGDRKLKDGELVLFDLGVVKDGYTSDVTRTIAFGEVPKEARTVYEVVFEAQHKAFEAVKPGITASELDKIARDWIEDAGYGEYFTHRLGHGLGKSVHEYPSLSQGNDLVIQEGMCFSLEPGVYIPNEIGVRIEDCVYVTKNGSIPFTHTSKKLTYLRNQ